MQRARPDPFLGLLLAVILAAAVAAAARADLPTLYVDYSIADCTFRFTNDSGASVTSIAPGTYQVVIETPQPLGLFDLSGRTDLYACKGFVSFRLTGAGINLQTTLEYGDSAFEQYPETFQAGATYTVQDDNNVAGTRRSFTVATSGSAPVVASAAGTGSTSKKGTPSTDLTGSAVVPFRGALDAIVPASGKLSLSRNGRKVASLKTGRYTFAVDDESKSTGFSVQVLNGKPTALTSVGFVGSHDVTIRLKPGRWTFFTPGGPRSTFFVVA